MTIQTLVSATPRKALLALLFSILVGLVGCGGGSGGSDGSDDSTISASDLSGTWGGTIETSSVGIASLTVDFDGSGNISAVSIGGTDQGISATLDGTSTNSDRIFTYSIDGASAAVYVNSAATHAGILLEDGTVGVLEKGTTSGTFAVDDAVGSWAGEAAYIVAPFSEDGIDTVSGSFSSVTGGASSSDVEFSSSSGTCSGINVSLTSFMAATGVYDGGTASGGTGVDCPTGVAADAYMSYDANFMVLYAGCEAGITVDGCSFVILSRTGGDGGGTTPGSGSLGGDTSATGSLKFALSSNEAVSDFAFLEGSDSVAMTIYDANADTTKVVVGDMSDGSLTTVSGPNTGSGPELTGGAGSPWSTYGIVYDAVNDRYIVGSFQNDAFTVDPVTGDRAQILDPNDGSAAFVRGGPMEFGPNGYLYENLSGWAAYQVYQQSGNTVLQEVNADSTAEVLGMDLNPTQRRLYTVNYGRLSSLDPFTGNSTVISADQEPPDYANNTPAEPMVGEGPGIWAPILELPSDVAWDAGNNRIYVSKEATILSVDPNTGDRTTAYNSCQASGPVFDSISQIEHIPGTDRALVYDLTGDGVYEVTLDPDGPTGGRLEGTWENIVYTDTDVVKRRTYTGTGDSGTGMVHLYGDQSRNQDLFFWTFDWTKPGNGTYTETKTKTLYCDGGTWTDTGVTESTDMNYSVACGADAVYMELSGPNSTRTFLKDSGSVTEQFAGDPCDP